MKKYFLNPEIKISSTVLLGLMCFFMFLQLGIFKIYNEGLKEDYLKSVGAITARVIEQDPELESNIISIVTKGITEKEGEKGKAILAKYGVTISLENELFPHMNSITQKNRSSTVLIFIFMTLALCSLNYFQHSIFYEKIRNLTWAAQKVVDGDYEVAINENKEGDFSKLAASFNSMREIIRNNINELKTEKIFLVNLLSDISHQLKTPLSFMIIYNDIMLNKDLTKEQSEKFHLENQCQLNRMQSLIENMLKLARIDAKAIEFDKKNQSLNCTIQDVVETLKSKAEVGKVCMEFACHNQVDLEHDRFWLEEALINIVKNAIEHTNEGGFVKIDLSENPIYKRITVEDTGQGIEEEDLPNIFKRFYKTKTSTKSDSVGIGLALAKSIVESHNGIIEARSKVSEGTKIIITFLKY